MQGPMPRAWDIRASGTSFLRVAWLRGQVGYKEQLDGDMSYCEGVCLHSKHSKEEFGCANAGRIPMPS